MEFILVRSASGTYYQSLGGSARETYDIGRAHRFSSAEEAIAAGREMPGFWSVTAAPPAQPAKPASE